MVRTFSKISFPPASLRFIHTIVLILIYAVIGFKSFLQFSNKYDFLNYHFPFVLRYLGHYNIEYLYPLHESFWKGNPMLAVWTQALMIRLTGLYSAASGLGFLGLALVVCCLRWLFGSRFQLSWFLTGCLAIPLVALNFGTGYDDLWMSAWVTLAFGALLKLTIDEVELKTVVCFLIGESGGCFSKILAWPPATLFAIAFIIVLWRKSSELSAPIKIFVSLLISLIIFSWPVRNWVLFHNPTYPHAFPFIDSLFPKPSYNIVQAADKNFGFSNTLTSNHNGVNFLVSVFELTRLWAKGRPLYWSHEQWSPGIHQRQGGWNWLTMLLMFSFLLYSIRRNWIPKATLITFLAMVLVVANLPGSWNLRYWMYLPLCGLLLLTTLPRPSPHSMNCFLWFKGGLLVSALYVLLQTVVLRGPYGPISPKDVASLEVQTFWSEHTPNDWKHLYLIKLRPDAIFWTGPTFSQYYIVAE
jgi:hypothetical protein